MTTPKKPTKKKAAPPPPQEAAEATVPVAEAPVPTQEAPAGLQPIEKTMVNGVWAPSIAELRERIRRHGRWIVEPTHPEAQRAYLRGAYLQGAYLRGAYLQGADLRGAYLRGAYLQGAYLQGADLQGADLQGAYLSDEQIAGMDLAICPPEGAFTAYKVVRGGVILVVEVPAEAARTWCLVNRKCRASALRVLRAEDLKGNPVDATEFISKHDDAFVYRVGETAAVSNFSNDPRVDCAPGLHFWVTKREAVAWS